MRDILRGLCLNQEPLVVAILKQNTLQFVHWLTVVRWCVV